MKRLWKTFGLAVALAAAGVAGSGCVAVVAAGAAGGTVAYVRGALQVTLDGSVDEVASASKAALADLKFVQVSSKVDAISGEIIARTAQDTKIEINLKKQTEKATMVDIRVGVFGDKAVSQQILDQIRKNL